MIDLNCTPLTRLSQRKPGIPSSEYYYAQDVITALKSFLYENFRGLATLEIDCVDSATVKISIEHLAYTIKLLLKSINGRAFVSITASVTSEALVLRFEIDAPPELSEKEQALIVSAASHARFELFDSKCGFSLRAKAEEKQNAAYVYANEPELIKRAMVKIFFE